MCSLALHDSEKSVIYASASLLFVILHWMNGIIPLIKVATLLDQAESPCMILTPGETAELFIFRDLDAISGSFGALQDGIPRAIFIVFWDYCTWRFFCSCPFSSESRQQTPEPGVSTLGSRTNPDTGSKPSKAECAAHSGFQSGLSYIDLCGEAHMCFVDTHTPKHTQSLPTAFTFFLKFHVQRM